MYKSIIFDLDGTLIDSSEGIIKSVTKTIKHFKLPMLSNENLLKFIGPPIQNSCKAAYGTYDTFAQEFANYFRQEYAAGDVFCSYVYKGIFDLLDFLKNSGCILGIATYKREDYAISLVEHLDLSRYFSNICGADNENKLTKKDILINCIQQLKSKTGECIFIGDTKSDASAAEFAGVDFIAAGWGFELTKDNYNSSIFTSPDKMLRYFQEQLGKDR